jgi:hypothetical protein
MYAGDIFFKRLQVYACSLVLYCNKIIIMLRIKIKLMSVKITRSPNIFGNLKLILID